jgi:succinate dehydrogenase/fumarate reductase cytochrome b subunit
MLWAYFAFSQYLIIWSGNLPEEIVYYLERIHGLWGATIIAIGLLHFAAPFLFLLSRDLKRSGKRLMRVALLVLVMRMVDLIWMLVPAFHGHNAIWLDVVALIGFGGLWLGIFAWQLGKRALIPINDPQFESVLATDAHR